MGTGNFMKRNASSYFVVLERENDQDVDQLTEDIAWSIMHREPKMIDLDRVPDKAYNRSYPASPICTVYASGSFYGVEVGIELDVILRLGYYEAAVLDYEIRFFANTFNEEDISLAGECFFDACNNHGNAGMSLIQSRNAQRWADKESKRLIGLVEEVFKMHSAEYMSLGHASNGEAFYRKVNS